MVKFMVGKKSDLPEGKMTHITAGGKEILVANVEGAYYAIGNICITQAQNYMKVN